MGLTENLFESGLGKMTHVERIMHMWLVYAILPSYMPCENGNFFGSHTGEHTEHIMDMQSVVSPCVEP